MNGVRTALEFYRLHVAIAAFFITLSINKTLNYSFGLRTASASGLLALAIYLFDRTSKSPEDQINEPAAHAQFSRWSPLLRWTLSALLISLAVSLLRIVFSSATLILILAIVVFGALYASTNTKRLLGKGTILKNLIPAASWTLACVGIPATLQPQASAPSLTVWLVALFVFVAELQTEIFWDIRDRAGDQLNGVKTLPLSIGVASAVRLAIFSAIAMALITGALILTQELPSNLWVILPQQLVTAYLFSGVNEFTPKDKVSRGSHELLWSHIGFAAIQVVYLELF
jgi:4-hydroxybenzoate polyprenyltransferase